VKIYRDAVLEGMTMAKDGQSDNRLTTHPVIQQLVGEQTGLSNGMILRGYIGPSTSEDRITVFPTLDDLSQSFELARADVLAVNEAPEALLPNGGKVIWVKSDAVITQRNTKTAQQYVQMRKGRLSITMLRRLGESDVCMHFDCENGGGSGCDEMPPSRRVPIRFR
jgi:hypothetical protein